MNAGAAAEAPGLQQLGGLVEERLGLRFHDGNADLLQRGLQRLGATQGPLAAALYAELGRSRTNQPPWQRLIAEIAVGETYFFRHPEDFTVLQRQILPALHAAAPLRLWSAGCATGEEAYSLALCLAAAAPAVEYEVVGSDVNEAALAVAERGAYGPRSLRGAMAGWEAALLHGTDGQRRLPAELRRRVRFISHNLADRAASAPVGAPFHVIFCRNVLIYFGARAAARVLEQLARCLAPGGYVFVSPLDLGHRVAELAPVEVGGVWLFRKEIPRPTHPPTDRPAPSWPPRAPTPPSPRSPGGDPVQEARQAADRGDLQTATAIARQAVTDQRSPTALHLLALILGEQDQRDEMRRLLEEAVARDAGYVQGHLCLGLLPTAASEHPAAARHLAAVLTLLAGAADQDVLPGPEPLRVALARHLAEQGQRNLQRAGSGGTP